MTPAARLTLVLDLLTEVETTPRPVDALTSARFRAAREMTEADRAEVIETLYAVLRHRARLGWHLSRLGVAEGPRPRLLAWLRLGARRKPDEIRRLAAPLSEAEAALVAALEGSLTPPDMPEPVRLECPDWALAPLSRRFGADLGPEMAAMLAPPPLDLRVNPVKAQRDSVLRGLRAEGIAAHPLPLTPHGIRLEARLSLSRLAGLRRGDYEIQDEGSQRVAGLVGARPGERVVDFCAGAGGKSLALAAGMDNRGHVVACDISAARLKRAAERLRLAGLHNVQTRLLTSETDKWVKRHKGTYDRVLVDAPCSGTGTWRRNPDARWRAPDLGLEGLMELQGRILASAARLVRPGGRLVYATCSVLVEENEDQVAAFLGRHPDFTQAEVLSLTPARDGTDGFFAAALTRS